MLTLAGALAPRSSWSALWLAWQDALKAAGVAVFHATECEGAQREFRGWSPQLREQFQRTLLDLVIDPEHDLMIYSTSLALEPYHDLEPRLREILRFPPGLSISGSLHDAYFILFQQLIQMLATEPYVSELPNNESVGFTFDRHRFGPRAKALGEAMYRFRPFGFRIRGTGFMNKNEIVPLQVADLVAYEAYRFERETHLEGKDERWQYTLLRSRWRKSVFMDRDYLERTVRGMEEKHGAVTQNRQNRDASK